MFDNNNNNKNIALNILFSMTCVFEKANLSLSCKHPYSNIRRMEERNGIQATACPQTKGATRCVELSVERKTWSTNTRAVQKQSENSKTERKPGESPFEYSWKLPRVAVLHVVTLTSTHNTVTTKDVSNNSNISSSGWANKLKIYMWTWTVRKKE